MLDLMRGGSRPAAPKPRDHGDVALARAKARDPHAGDFRALVPRRIASSSSIEGRRFGHEDVGLGRVETSRSSATYAASTPSSARSRIVDSRLRHELGLGWIQVARADERNVGVSNDAVVEQHPRRHPPQVPGR